MDAAAMLSRVTDLSVQATEALTLTARPRKPLGWRSPPRCSTRVCDQRRHAALRRSLEPASGLTVATWTCLTAADGYPSACQIRRYN